MQVFRRFLWDLTKIRSGLFKGILRVNPALQLCQVQRQYFGAAPKVSLPSFNRYEFSPQIKAYLQEHKYHTPTPIQDLVIPELLEGNRWIYFAAQTGTGKTLAYLLPILQQIKKEEQEQGTVTTMPNRPRVIILVPNKELVQQVLGVTKSICHHIKLKSMALSPQRSLSEEKKLLNEGVDIVVSTIDRLEKLRDKEGIFFSNVRYFVVDEADTFVDMGDREIIEGYIDLLRKTKSQPRMILVSATLTGPLTEMLDSKFGNDLTAQNFRKIIEKKTHMNLSNLNHEFIHIQDYDKQGPMLNVLGELKKGFAKGAHSLMLFCNTIPSCQSLEYVLKENGYECVSLHGDVPAKMRIQNFERFRRREVNILISTDLGSRGLDFPFLTHVINFDCPKSASDYLHRAGRAGRAGKRGTVISLYHKKDLELINELKAAHENDAPLKIKGSAYAMINKEILVKARKESNQLRREDKLDKRAIKLKEKLLPKSYLQYTEKLKKSGNTKALEPVATKERSVLYNDTKELKRALRVKRKMMKSKLVDRGRIEEMKKGIKKIRHKVYQDKLRLMKRKPGGKKAKF